MVVRLSQPSPHHAFAHRWAGPSAIRGLTRLQRQQLLCLTASTGVFENLEVAVAVSGLLLSAEVFVAAAASGQLDACQWLHQRGCPAERAQRHQYMEPDGPCALIAAAGAGQQAVCEWLLGNVLCPWTWHAVLAAARGGHLDLARRLLRLRPTSGHGGGCHGSQGPRDSDELQAVLDTDGPLPPLPDDNEEPTSQKRLTLHDRSALVAAAAHGCDLSSFQQFYRAMLPEMDPKEQQRRQDVHAALGMSWLLFCGPLEQCKQWKLLEAAAGSPTSDWRGKVEWLEAQGHKSGADGAMAAAVACPDGPDRFEWLLGRDYRCTTEVVDAAADAGHTEIVLLLLEYADQLLDVYGEYSTRPDDLEREAARGAAAHGHLTTLQRMHAKGYAADYPALSFAAANGQFPVVEWLLGNASADIADRLATEANARLCIFCCAAGLGDTHMMAWLQEHGISWGAKHGGEVWASAAAAGSEEALEWLIERGCPMGDDGAAYVTAFGYGDLRTLRLLRQLGYPWGAAAGKTFTDCVAAGCRDAASCLPLLAWLLGAGCPVDWDAATEAARGPQRERRSRFAREQAEKERAESERVVAWLEEQRARHE